MDLHNNCWIQERMNADFDFPFFPHCLSLPSAAISPPCTFRLFHFWREDGFMFSRCSTYYKLLWTECGWLPWGCLVWKVLSKPQRFTLLMAAGGCSGRKHLPVTGATRCGQALKRDCNSLLSELTLPWNMGRCVLPLPAPVCPASL